MKRQAFLKGAAALGTSLAIAPHIGSGTGLAAAAPEAVPATFTFSTWGDFRFYKEAFMRLQKAYPHYASVQFKNQEATAQGATAGADVLTQRLLAGYLAKAWGTMPDVCELNSYALGQLADAGLLVDMTAWIKPYTKDLAPAVVQSVSYKGRIFACPWRANTAQLYYRTDLWSEAGVKAENIKTWDDYIAAGRAIKAHRYADGKQRYIMNQDATPGFNLDFLTQQGGQIFDTTTGKLLIDSDPRFRRAFETQVALYKAGIGGPIASWTPAWFQGFKDGTLTSIISEVWMDAILQQNAPETSGKWRVMPLPAVTPGGSRYAINSSAIVVAINKPGLSVELVKRYIQHSFLDKATLTSLSNLWHFPPAYLPASSDKASLYNQPSTFYGGQVLATVDREIQQKGYTAIYTNKHVPVAQQYINAAFGDAALGKTTSSAAIAKAAAKIRAAS